MNALRILLIIVIILFFTFNESAYWKYFFSFLIPYYIITQLILFKSPFDTLKRKAFTVMWSHPYDPQIYGRIKLRLEKTEEFLRKYSEKCGTVISLTTFGVKLMALMLTKNPQLNGNIIFGRVSSNIT